MMGAGNVEKMLIIFKMRNLSSDYFPKSHKAYPVIFLFKFRLTYLSFFGNTTILSDRILYI